MESQWRVTPPYIPPHRTQVHPRMQGLSSKPINNKTKVVISIAFVLMVPSVYYLFTTAQKVHQSSKFADPTAEFHGIVMDWGPTSARAHVFKWLGDEHLPFVDHIKVSNSKYRTKSIKALIDFAKNKVPKKEWANTKVQLIIINSIVENNNVLEECRQLLRASGFAFKDAWARVARRQDKGIYSWIAANYALGTLGAKPQQTTGILQLDAASLQVTFAVKESQYSQSIRFAGVTYNLYTQSLPQFGQDAAWELLHEFQNSIELKAFSNSSGGLVDNPCIPKGYELTTNTSDRKLMTFHPAGNFSACRSEALALLAKRQDKCLHPPCQILSSFPELQSKPVSPENFLYTSEFLGLVPWASLSELETFGRHYCDDDWDKLKNQHHSIDDLDLLRYCFFSAYTVALLHDSLGIPMHDKRIELSNNARSIPLDWTLGAFIFQSMLDPPESEVENLDQIVGNESITYLSLCAFLVIAMLAAFFVVQWRKPQLKTIYDLEKGHYIVTRMPS